MDNDHAWPQFGGVKFFYGLRTENGRRSLNPTENPFEDFSIILDQVINGEKCGLVRCYAHDFNNPEQKYDIWLFPDSLPNFLLYRELLVNYMNGSSLNFQIRALKSVSDPNILFLKEIKRPF
jgi:hypothetical protein